MTDLLEFVFMIYGIASVLVLFPIIQFEPFSSLMNKFPRGLLVKHIVFVLVFPVSVLFATVVEAIVYLVNGSLGFMDKQVYPRKKKEKPTWMK